MGDTVIETELTPNVLQTMSAQEYEGEIEQWMVPNKLREAT